MDQSQHGDYWHGYYTPACSGSAVAWHNDGWVMRKRMESDIEVGLDSPAASAISRFLASGRAKWAEIVR